MQSSSTPISTPSRQASPAPLSTPPTQATSELTEWDPVELAQASPTTQSQHQAHVTATRATVAAGLLFTEREERREALRVAFQEAAIEASIVSRLRRDGNVPVSAVHNLTVGDLTLTQHRGNVRLWHLRDFTSPVPGSQSPEPSPSRYTTTARYTTNIGENVLAFVREDNHNILLGDQPIHPYQTPEPQLRPSISQGPSRSDTPAMPPSSQHDTEQTPLPQLANNPPSSPPPLSAIASQPQPPIPIQSLPNSAIASPHQPPIASPPHSAIGTLYQWIDVHPFMITERETSHGPEKVYPWEDGSAVTSRSSDILSENVRYRPFLF